MNRNKLNYAILFLFSAAALFTSCSDAEEEIFNGPHFTSFNLQPSTLSVDENAGSRDIFIGISQAQDTDVTINLDVTNGTAVQGEDFTLSSSSVTIPAGEVTGSFSIMPIDNSVFNESTTFTIEISSVSDSNINIGNASQASYFKNVTIVNDDCPTMYNIWFGPLAVQDVGYADIEGVVGSATPAGTCDVLLVVGDLGGFGPVPEDGFEFYLTPYFEGATSGTVSVPSQTYCEGCSNDLDVNFSGEGTYDETTQTIILSYDVRRTDNAGYTGTNIINPAN